MPRNRTNIFFTFCFSQMITVLIAVLYGGDIWKLAKRGMQLLDGLYEQKLWCVVTVTSRKWRKKKEKEFAQKITAEKATYSDDKPNSIKRMEDDLWIDRITRKRIYIHIYVNIIFNKLLTETKSEHY